MTSIADFSLHLRKFYSLGAPVVIGVGLFGSVASAVVIIHRRNDLKVILSTSVLFLMALQIIVNLANITIGLILSFFVEVDCAAVCPWSLGVAMPAKSWQNIMLPPTPQSDRGWCYAVGYLVASDVLRALSYWLQAAIIAIQFFRRHRYDDSVDADIEEKAGKFLSKLGGITLAPITVLVLVSLACKKWSQYDDHVVTSNVVQGLTYTGPAGRFVLLSPCIAEFIFLGPILPVGVIAFVATTAAIESICCLRQRNGDCSHQHFSNRASLIQSWTFLALCAPSSAYFAALLGFLSVDTDGSVDGSSWQWAWLRFFYPIGALGAYFPTLSQFQIVLTFGYRDYSRRSNRNYHNRLLVTRQQDFTTHLQFSASPSFLASQNCVQIEMSSDDHYDHYESHP